MRLRVLFAIHGPADDLRWVSRRHGAAARVTAEASQLDVVCRQWADRLYDVVDRHARAARRMEGRRDVVL